MRGLFGMGACLPGCSPRRDGSIESTLRSRGCGKSLYRDSPDSFWELHVGRLNGVINALVVEVPNAMLKRSVQLCNRFIEFQAEGGRIPEGQEVRMATLPTGLTCRHRGQIDDPEFNNVHVEIRFPLGR